MEDSKTEQKDDFPLRWWEWAWMIPILAVFMTAARISAWMRRLLEGKRPG